MIADADMNGDQALVAEVADLRRRLADIEQSPEWQLIRNIRETTIDAGDPLTTQAFVSRAVWLLQQYIHSLMFYTRPGNDEVASRFGLNMVNDFDRRLKHEVFTEEDRSS